MPGPQNPNQRPPAPGGGKYHPLPADEQERVDTAHDGFNKEMSEAAVTAQRVQTKINSRAARYDRHLEMRLKDLHPGCMIELDREEATHTPIGYFVIEPKPVPVASG